MLWQTHDLCITIPTTEQGIEKMNKKSTVIWTWEKVKVVTNCWGRWTKPLVQSEQEEPKQCN